MKINPEPRFFQADDQTKQVSSRIKPFPLNTKAVSKARSFDAEYQTSLAAGKVHSTAMLSYFLR
jgi:hypothetical protein